MSRESPDRPGAASGPAVPPDEGAEARARDADARVFGQLLSLSGRVALAGAALAFALVVIGVLPVRIALDQLPLHWGGDAATWRAALTGHPASWPALAQGPWLARSPGELGMLIAIGALCLAPVPALGALALRLARRGDRLFAALAMAHVAVIVLTLAAAFG
jgi:hypothetical protein